ncbi:MAG: hypothetical protein AB7Q29_09575 [Vicinamibacterales bacterium]
MTDHPSERPAARLLITRDNDADVRQRQIFASLDGTGIGDILFGERIDRPIAPGRHRLRVHNTLFWKTEEFDAAPGELVHFSTVNTSGRGIWSLMLLFIGVAPLFLTVTRAPEPRT